MTSPDDNAYIARKNRELGEKETELQAERLQREAAARAQSRARARADEAEEEASQLREKLEESEKKLEAAQAAILTNDELIRDWMYKNEAMKRVAKKYGKELGKSPEQIQAELDENFIDIAEEDPSYQKTSIYNGAKKRLGLA